MSKPTSITAKKSDGGQKAFKAPNPIIIIACIILVSALASYFVPAGMFDRIEDPGTGRMVVDPSTFHYIAQSPIGLFDMFKSVTLGIQGGSSIISFLFIIGGAFGIMEATGAIKSGMAALVRKMQGRELLLVPVCMIVFGCGAAFAANNEEYLAFLPLVLTICLAMGFDSMTAVAIIFASVGAGYGAGCTNAFTVGVAQGIAGLPIFSGIGYRLLIFAVLLVINICYVMRYALKVKKNPQSSPMYEYDSRRVLDLDVNTVESLTGRHKLVLLTFLLTIVCLVIGVTKLGFYIDELAALFLIMGIVAGIIGGLKPAQVADSFVKGCSNMLLPCLMVGLCKATTIIMTDANIMDTIIHALASVLNKVPSTFTAFGMFVVQDIFNIIVPSGSGQAAITMPIMAPLADLVGVTRQTAVLAFQFGDAFTNPITPASGMTMSCLAIAGVPYNKWLKFMLPLLALWWVAAFVFLTYATVTGFGPF